MLRKIGSSLPHSPVLQLEAGISAIVSLLLGKSVTLQYHVLSSPQTGKCYSFAFQSGTVPVTISVGQSSLTESSFAQGMLRFSAEASQVHGMGGLRPATTLAASEALRFQALSGEQVLVWLGEGEIAKVWPLVADRQAARDFTVRLALLGTVEAATGTQTVATVDFCLGLGSRRHPLRLRERAGTITLSLKEEEGMNECETPVTLDLGFIEVSLAELLAIRPGCEIEVECPEAFDVVLKVAYTSIAKGKAYFEGGRLRLQVVELLYAPPKRTEFQFLTEGETFQAEPR